MFFFRILTTMQFFVTNFLLLYIPQIMFYKRVVESNGCSPIAGKEYFWILKKDKRNINYKEKKMKIARQIENDISDYVQLHYIIIELQIYWKSSFFVKIIDF